MVPSASSAVAISAAPDVIIGHERRRDPLTGEAMTFYAGPMGQNGDDRRARLAARLERMDADLGPVKQPKAMTPRAWFWLVGLLLFCALFMHGAQRVGWMVFIAVGVLVELAIRRWQKRKR
jgi:hypothetical protein